jgi:hypothetical protein
VPSHDGLPDGWTRVDKVDTLWAFVHTSGATAVFEYAELFGRRRVIITMRGDKRLPSPPVLGTLATEIVPGMALSWTLATAFGGHPFTLCVVEDGDSPLPDTFTPEIT